MNIDYKAIGMRIRNRRKALGWTQQRLAEMSDLSDTNISHIERGATKLSLPSLIAIANALDITTDYLLMDNVEAAELPLRNEFAALLKDCTKDEYKLLYSICKSVLESQR